MKWTSALVIALSLATLCFTILYASERATAELQEKIGGTVDRIESRLNAHYAPLRWLGDLTSPVVTIPSERPKLKLTTTVTTPNGTVVIIEVTCGQPPAPSNETEDDFKARFAREIAWYKTHNPDGTTGN